VCVVVILDLYVVFLVSLKLSPLTNATLVLILLNLAVIYAADRMGTSRRHLVKIVIAGAVITVTQTLALIFSWAYTTNGEGWFMPLLVAALVSAALVTVRASRGYAVAVGTGTVNAMLAAFIWLVAAIPPS
jgi:hypothetical protein